LNPKNTIKIIRLKNENPLKRKFHINSGKDEKIKIIREIRSENKPRINILSLKPENFFCIYTLNVNNIENKMEEVINLL
jgi:hypothetical protein